MTTDTTAPGGRTTGENAAPDRLMWLLRAVSDTYLPLVIRKDRAGRHRPTVTAPLSLTVAERREPAEGVAELKLTDASGAPLPRWQPGAHLLLRLPSGRTRHYSLCGDPADRHHYRIAVRRIDGGGGGSVEVHEELMPGTRVTARGPRNAFPFPADRPVLFLAGGIGITPLLPMAREAARRNQDWHLIHTGRSRATMPYGDELTALGPERVTRLADDERAAPGPPDAAELLHRAPAGAAVYVCGPEPMLAAVRRAPGAGGAGGAPPRPPPRGGGGALTPTPGSRSPPRRTTSR
jgi:ferredoxin-NADP reductase